MARTTENIPEREWTIVATAVTSGTIRRPLNMGQYSFFWTTRASGGAAPSDTTDTSDIELDSGDAQRLFDNNVSEEIASSSSIDVYIWAYNNDDDSSDTASLIVDL